jgi:hypothetical protein
MIIRRLNKPQGTGAWRTLLAAAMLTHASGANSVAAEPNETFATATVLGPGVLMVSDSLTPGTTGNEPNTILGTRNSLGDLDVVDDDSSVYGNGFASGAFDVPIPFGSINFAVTGYANFSFDGIHDENGLYRVIVDVFQEGVPEAVAQRTEVRSLAVDGVDEFTFFDNDWVNGTYNVNIDNVIPVGGDVDFFRFTGLTAGASFTAETLAAGLSDVDTYLGWFNANGALTAADDDGAGGTLSKLAGVVPAGGALTFAVSGYGDDGFSGMHFENDAYQLKLTLGGGTLTADFDHSGGVRAADLALWTSNFAGAATGDADADGDTDGHDFLLWQQQLGSGVGAAQIPEPAASVMAACAIAGCGVARRRAPRRILLLPS